MSVEQFEKIQKEFQETITTLTKSVQKRDEELKALGAADEKTGQEIKELNDKLETISGDYKELLEKVSGTEESVNEFLKKRNRPAIGNSDYKSLGAQVVDSSAYSDMISNRSGKSNGIPIESFRQIRANHMTAKALSTDAGSAGALIDPTRVPGIFSRPLRQPRLRDLMVTQTTDESKIEFIEESAFNMLYTESDAEAAAAQAVVSVENANGFYAQQKVTVGFDTAQEEPATVLSVDYDENTLTLTANLTNTHPAGNAVVSDTFVFTPEAKLKPRAQATFVSRAENMKTLAHWIPATRQILKNRQMLRQHIDNRMLEGLALSEEKQILYGNGDDQQLAGILTNTRIHHYEWSKGAAGDSKIDAVRRGLTLAQLAHYPVDGIVMNPLDWEDVELQKGNDGHYIWVNVAQGGEPRLWRAPLVISSAIEPGDALAGAFGMGAALWDRDNPQIRVSEDHKDYFTHNMVAILAEQEMCQTIYRPESFTHIEFDEAPASE